MPGDLSPREAHDRGNRTEATIMAAVQDVTVTIHVELEGKGVRMGIVGM